MNTQASHTAPAKDSLQEHLPESPLDAWRALAIGMNNGQTLFVFKFNNEDQAKHFDSMTESVTRRTITVVRDKNIVTVIYKR